MKHFIDTVTGQVYGLESDQLDRLTPTMVEMTPAQVESAPQSTPAAARQ